MAVKASEAQLHCVSSFSNYEIRAEINSVQSERFKPTLT